MMGKIGMAVVVLAGAGGGVWLYRHHEKKKAQAMALHAAQSLVSGTPVASSVRPMRPGDRPLRMDGAPQMQTMNALAVQSQIVNATQARAGLVGGSFSTPASPMAIIDVARTAANRAIASLQPPPTPAQVLENAAAAVDQLRQQRNQAAAALQAQANTIAASGADLFSSVQRMFG